MLTSKEGKVDTFFRILEWTLFLALCIVSNLFLKEVWHKYETYDSNVKTSSKMVKSAPTLMICFWPSKNKANNQPFEQDKGFSMFYATDNINFERNKTKLVEGNMIIPDDGEKTKVSYEKIDTFEDGSYRTCHKISSEFIPKSKWDAVKINFDGSILKENLPIVDIYITSEENSYGRIFSKYHHGKKTVLKGKFGDSLSVELLTEQRILLDETQSPKSKCAATGSFYECLEENLLKEISNNCSNICFPPVTTINSSIPKCQNEEESNCAKNIILLRKYDNDFLKKCATSCKTTQYTVTNQYLWNYDTIRNKPDQESKNWFWLWYILSNDLGC